MTLRQSKHSGLCSRCVEPLVNEPRHDLCIWCEEELTRRSLRTATEPGFSAPASVLADAIDWLRRHGYSDEQAQTARAAIRAGVDIEDAARALEESRDGEVVAA